MASNGIYRLHYNSKIPLLTSTNGRAPIECPPAVRYLAPIPNLRFVFFVPVLAPLPALCVLHGSLYFSAESPLDPLKVGRHPAGPLFSNFVSASGRTTARFFLTRPRPLQPLILHLQLDIGSVQGNAKT